MSIAVETRLPRSIQRSGTTDVRESLSLQMFTSFDDAEAAATEWDRLIDRLGGSLYMTFDWCRIWWRHYGSARDLRLFLVREGEDLVGVLPFFLEKVGLPLLRARVAKMVGSDFTVAMVDPPLRSDIATEAFSQTMGSLFADDECDVVLIGPAPTAASQLELLRAAAVQAVGNSATVRHAELGFHTVFDLPHGFEAYMQGLSKNQRSNYRRNLNKLNSAFKFQVDVVSDPVELEREFGAFVEMHQAQWNAANRLGHFGDWPKALEFTRDMIRKMASMDRVRLIRFAADHTVVAYYFCYKLDRSYYWWLPARLTGEQWDQFALGRVGLLKMLETAALEGATTVEAGRGWYEYKEKLNARSLPLQSFALSRKGAARFFRVHALLALGGLLNLLYYRLWFLRIAPRLGFPRGPLWDIWIRTRF